MSTTKWVIDPTHSEIAFKVKHMMFTNVTGKFQKFDANIITVGDDFTDAKIYFSGAVDSLTTGNADRDTHLLSPDFFDAAQYPEIEFIGNSFTKNNEGEFALTGSLKLRGISKNVNLTADYSGLMKDPWGNVKAGFTIAAKINRKDWGLTWNSALETGGVLVGEDVSLEIELQFIKQ
ncbi:YceI family protein [Flavobacterium aquidurense]|uniref:YceI family protein n=1 Tax=Flavobacterium aquidurense TaxID=362413 RepID=UPI00286710A2|nr:YceI family protein [Flavobacterium aquidurense]MDR7369926.1 polyisoprenoid-binding protein YceI [Flavobacterium aquidurense]